MHIISQDLIDRIIGALEESGELWCETCKMIIDDDNWHNLSGDHNLVNEHKDVIDELYKILETVYAEDNYSPESGKVTKGN